MRKLNRDVPLDAIGNVVSYNKEWLYFKRSPRRMGLGGGWG